MAGIEVDWRFGNVRGTAPPGADDLRDVHVVDMGMPGRDHLQAFVDGRYCSIIYRGLARHGWIGDSGKLTVLVEGREPGDLAKHDHRGTKSPQLLQRGFQVCLEDRKST